MVYVITGGPGFGKTALITKLSELGYPVGGEIARQMIIDQKANGGGVLPWIDVAGFEKQVMEERIKFIKSIDIDEIAFSDRGLPDQVAFSLLKGKKVSQQLIEALATNNYAKRVFLTPPWRQIYRNDPIRTETFEEAENIHRHIKTAYINFGYELIELPFASPEKRIEFILNSL